LVRRDENFAFSVADYTPTVRRTDEGNGDEDPYTLILGLLKEADGPMTPEELWTALGERLFGQNRKAPGLTTVRRWLIRWKNEGMLVTHYRPQGGEKGGRPQLLYALSDEGAERVAAEAPSGEPEGLPAVPVSADVARAVLKDLGAAPAAQEVVPASGGSYGVTLVSYSDDDIPEEWR
jgi:DNA-binding PadR family transcriptional regulator